MSAIHVSPFDRACADLGEATDPFHSTGRALAPAVVLLAEDEDDKSIMHSINTEPGCGIADAIHPNNDAKHFFLPIGDDDKGDIAQFLLGKPGKWKKKS